MSTLASPARILLLACCLVSTGLGAADGGYATYRTGSAFEDVFDGLKAAIQERGMYINNVMNMGEMLERTGRDLGTTDPIYTEAKSIEFCSAVLSREMTLENPARIVNCPFIISVYARADETDTTYVAHRAIPDDEQAASPIMARIATMLKDISEAAIAW